LDDPEKKGEKQEEIHLENYYAIAESFDMIEKRKSGKLKKFPRRDKPDSMNVVYNIHYKHP
jgi:hypothetical protein